MSTYRHVDTRLQELAELREAHAERRANDDRELSLLVRRANEAGITWREIGEALGMSYEGARYLAKR